MDFLVAFISGTIKYVVMLVIAVGAVCLGAFLKKSKKSKE